MRVKYQLLSLIVALCAAVQSSASEECVVLVKRYVQGASVCVITADLNDSTIKVSICLPKKGIRHSEGFTSLVRRGNPLAAVTGTYFDMRTLVPTGSIVVDGKIVHENYVGTAVCFTVDNKVRFVNGKPGEACDLSAAECGIRTGPRLLANAQYALNPWREGFRHPGLFGARTRIALGITAHNKLLLAYVRTPVTFAKLASIMKSLSAVDAVCLDGGTSSAMYFKGSIVCYPGRMLTNIIEVRQRVPKVVPPKLIEYTFMRGTGQKDDVPNHWRIVYSSAQDNNGAPVHMPDLRYEQAAIMSPPIKLRLAKSIHALFPINRA